MKLTYEPVYRGRTGKGMVVEGVLKQRNGGSYITEYSEAKRRDVVHRVMKHTVKNTGVYRMLGY